MKILVTGASGFLGKYVIRNLWMNDKVESIVATTLRTNGYIEGPFGRSRKLSTIQCDLRSFQDVAALMVNDWDAIFHLAANPNTKSLAHNLVNTNVVGTHNLLQYCKPNTRFAFLSSAAVYGDEAAITGKACDETIMPNPTSVYASTKLAGESMVKAYRHLGMVRPVIFRPCALVGFHATHGLLLDIVRKLTGPDKALHLLGNSPGSVKPFAHANDVANYIVRTTLDTTLETTVNVGPEDELSVKEVAELTMSTLGIRKLIIFDGEASNWKGDNRLIQLVTTKARITGYNPQFLTSVDAVARVGEEFARFQRTAA